MPVLNVTLSISMMLLHGEFTNKDFAIQNQCYYDSGIFFSLYNLSVDFWFIAIFACQMLKQGLYIW